MSKIIRKTQKIFGANGNTDEFAVFGTMKNIQSDGGAEYSKDVEVLQNTAAYLNGWQSAVVANFAPFLEELNGITYGLTYQMAYLLQNGIPEWDDDTAYYINSIVVGSDSNIYRCLTDNCLNIDPVGDDGTNWYNYSLYGANQDLSNLSEEGQAKLDDKADINLSNLTAKGNAKFQYAPFAVNSGNIDASGNNITLLTAGGGSPVIIDYYVVPIGLMANVTEYGTTNKYQMTQTTGGYNTTIDYSSATPTWTMELNSDYYIPANSTVNFTIATKNYRGNPSGSYQNGVDIGIQGVKITYTYTDNSTEDILDQQNSGNFANWNTGGNHNASITLPVANKEVKSIAVRLYKYYRGATASWGSAWGISFKATGSISGSDTLIVKPCTITTADSKTNTFDGDYIYDCSSLADGTYKVMKSYTDGSLSIAGALSVQASAPLTPTDGDLWLDNSMFPLSLKKYDGTESEWVVNNDLVYLGDVTVASNVITAIKNRYFNACPALRYIVKTAKSGAKWYEVYSDGWCRQGGSCTSGTAVTFDKPFIDTDYTLSVTRTNKSAGGFTPSVTGDYTAEGYIE